MAIWPVYKRGTIVVFKPGKIAAGWPVQYKKEYTVVAHEISFTGSYNCSILIQDNGTSDIYCNEYLMEVDPYKSLLKDLDNV